MTGAASPSGLAAFYRAAGYDVLHAAGASWFNASARIYHCLPLARPIEPAPDALRRLVKDRGLVGAQYATGRGEGVPSGVFTVRDKAYGERSLHRTFRQNLRRGRCTVRGLGFDELEGLGLGVNRSAMAERPHGDARLTDPSAWRRFCEAAEASDGAGAVGSFVDDELAAYLLYYVEDGVSYGLHLLARRDLRAHRPNHLLYFEFTRRMMARADVSVVNTGVQSFPPRASMDRFKRHAGYVSEPCRLAVALRPWTRIVLCNSASRAMLALGRRALPGDPRLERARAVADMARAAAA